VKHLALCHKIFLKKGKEGGKSDSKEEKSRLTGRISQKIAISLRVFSKDNFQRRKERSLEVLISSHRAYLS
jgi:hypothetical protein